MKDTPKTIPYEEHRHDEKLSQAIRLIREMPDLEPPGGFVDAVMRVVETKEIVRREPTLWERLRKWANSPMSVTLTPVRLAGAATMVMLFFVAFTIWRQGALHDNPRLADLQEGVNVVFTLKAPDARSVAVIGTFNRWKADGFEMHKSDERDVWTIKVHLPEGRHEYTFLVDGERLVPDPDAALYQEDGFGFRNAVLIVDDADIRSLEKHI